MTYLASRSHGNWQRHYSIQRNKGRIAIATPEDLFALRPRFMFFADNLDELETVMAPAHFRKLRQYLEDTETKAKKYIARQSKSAAIQNKLVNIDYEQFYQLMLDAMIYGDSEELAFTEALKNTPKRSDKGSSKEFITSNEGAIEHFAESGPAPGAGPGISSFKMDYEKLKRSFSEQLLKERINSVRRGRAE